MSANRHPTIIVLYDHACPLCRTEMMKIKARDQGGQNVLKLIDISAPGFDAHAWGFAPESLSEALHVRDLAGYWHMGMDAIRLVYQSVGMGWILAPTRWPGMRQVFDKMYASLARNREGVSGFLGKHLGYGLLIGPCGNDDVCKLETHLATGRNVDVDGAPHA